MDYFWGAFRVASHPYTWVALTPVFIFLIVVSMLDHTFGWAIWNVVCALVSIYFLWAAIDFRRHPG